MLWALSPDQDDTAADLSSRPGFYTDDVAPTVDHVYAVDIQDAMHDCYQENGDSRNVELVVSSVDDLPLDTDSLDATFSTMTYHEFTNDQG